MKETKVSFEKIVHNGFSGFVQRVIRLSPSTIKGGVGFSNRKIPLGKGKLAFSSPRGQYCTLPYPMLQDNTSSRCYIPDSEADATYIEDSGISGVRSVNRT